MKRIRSIILLTWLPGAVFAAEAIGFVKTVSGTATVTSAGIEEPAAVGTAVHVGTLLRTGADGTLGVTFRDETMIALGPRTELTVDEYLYAPAEGRLKMNSRLARGTLDHVSGVIARLRPEGVSVTTPSGTIGVRGTRFLVRVED